MITLFGNSFLFRAAESRSFSRPAKGALELFTEDQNRMFESPNPITLFTSIFGALTGLCGTILGVSNFLRDRASAKVELQWDVLLPDGTTELDMGLVYVTSVGRRPLYIVSVSLELPPGASTRYMIVAESVYGKKLGEGEPAAHYVFKQDKLHPYAEQWRGIRARVDDSTGRVYFSKRPKQRPSWGR